MDISKYITREILEKCIVEKQALFKKIESTNYIVLIEKYQYVSKYDIKVLDKTGKYIIYTFDSLGAFDTYNMLEEFLINE